jgi:transposase
MSKRSRRRHSAEQKAELLRRHLVDKVPVSQICSEAKIQPSLFYNWQRDLLAAAPGLFAREKGTPNRERELEQRVEALTAKLAKKDAIIAEVSEEYVKLKKELGEL